MNLSLVLTPHVSAGTRDTFLQKMAAVFDNPERHWRGDPVENLVDLKTGLPGRAA